MHRILEKLTQDYIKKGGSTMKGLNSGNNADIGKVTPPKQPQISCPFMQNKT